MKELVLVALLAKDFKPAKVSLYSTGECYGETERLWLRYKEITLYDWRLKDEENNWQPKGSLLATTSLEKVPILYTVYTLGVEEERQRWKHRLQELIQ